MTATSELMAAARFCGTPERVDVDGSSVILRDDQRAVNLYASSSQTVTRIEATERDGVMVILRGMAGTSTITLNSTDNIAIGGIGTANIGPADSIILRYDKPSSKWHKVLAASH